MKKQYNIPATEVVAYMGDSMIMVGSPVGPTPTQDPANPNGNSTAAGGGELINP